MVERGFRLEHIFPIHIRNALYETDWQNGLEEIRVRVGQPIEFCGKESCVTLKQRTGENTLYVDGIEHMIGGETYRVTTHDVAEMMNYVCNYSLYVYKEEIKQGFITIEGGHRIGVAGDTVMDSGIVAGIQPITFLNIRVAHEHKGCAKEILPYIRRGSGICNTLFFSEPGAGKTTILRDCIRLLSDSTPEYPGLKVCVVDERYEIAASHLGVPQNDLGSRTDVLSGCSKSAGMQILLRAMSPQILAVDELGGEEDYKAVEQAGYAGCKVLGTIHAGDVTELVKKPWFRKREQREVFERYIWIKREKDGRRSIEVFDAEMERVC